MPMYEAQLNEADKKKLRKLHAEKQVAEAGHPGLSYDQCEKRIISYYEFLEQLHERYDLEFDEWYSMDLARGSIFEDNE